MEDSLEKCRCIVAELDEGPGGQSARGFLAGITPLNKLEKKLKFKSSLVNYCIDNLAVSFILESEYRKEDEMVKTFLQTVFKPLLLIISVNTTTERKTADIVRQIKSKVRQYEGMDYLVFLNATNENDKRVLKVYANKFGDKLANVIPFNKARKLQVKLNYQFPNHVVDNSNVDILVRTLSQSVMNAFQQKLSDLDIEYRVVDSQNFAQVFQVYDCVACLFVQFNLLGSADAIYNELDTICNAYGGAASVVWQSMDENGNWNNIEARQSQQIEQAYLHRGEQGADGKSRVSQNVDVDFRDMVKRTLDDLNNETARCSVRRFTPGSATMRPLRAEVVNSQDEVFCTPSLVQILVKAENPFDMHRNHREFHCKIDMKEKLCPLDFKLYLLSRKIQVNLRLNKMYNIFSFLNGFIEVCTARMAAVPGVKAHEVQLFESNMLLSVVKEVTNLDVSVFSSQADTSPGAVQFDSLSFSYPKSPIKYVLDEADQTMNLLIYNSFIRSRFQLVTASNSLAPQSIVIPRFSQLGEPHVADAPSILEDCETAEDNPFRENELTVDIAPEPVEVSLANHEHKLFFDELDVTFQCAQCGQPMEGPRHHCAMCSFALCQACFAGKPEEVFKFEKCSSLTSESEDCNSDPSGDPVAEGALCAESPKFVLTPPETEGVPAVEERSPPSSQWLNLTPRPPLRFTAPPIKRAVSFPSTPVRSPTSSPQNGPADYFEQAWIEEQFIQRTRGAAWFASVSGRKRTTFTLLMDCALAYSKRGHQQELQRLLPTLAQQCPSSRWENITSALTRLGVLDSQTAESRERLEREARRHRLEAALKLRPLTKQGWWAGGAAGKLKCTAFGGERCAALVHIDLQFNFTSSKLLCGDGLCATLMSVVLKGVTLLARQSTGTEPAAKVAIPDDDVRRLSQSGPLPVVKGDCVRLYFVIESGLFTTAEYPVLGRADCEITLVGSLGCEAVIRCPDSEGGYDTAVCTPHASVKMACSRE